VQSAFVSKVSLFCVFSIRCRAAASNSWIVLHVKSSGIDGSHGNKTFLHTLPVLVVDFGKGDFILPSEKESTDDFGEPE
jgi:hypothetical protein